ncbi:MAG: RNA polymerase sigma factor [Planctomycetota bacterium]|nr:RNA polymerase sigma factor [Planctomycetota bacterium]
MSNDRTYDYGLVDRFKAGDQDAFSELYERHRETVYRVAFKVVLNKDDALDIVQETFITAHRALHKFEQRAAVSTWLCQIGVHRAIDLTRRRKHRSSEATEYQAATAASKLTRGTTTDAEPYDPVAAATNTELQHRLSTALSQVGEKHRDVFFLYSLKGMSYKEISDQLDISIGTVMSRLFYARKKLQTLLADFVKERNAG